MTVYTNGLRVQTLGRIPSDRNEVIVSMAFTFYR